mgnify:CR=1 FL=1
MLTGTFAVERVVEESTCRSSKDYRFTDIGVYKIHSVALMPLIPFGEAMSTPQSIDKSIFLNAKETKLSVATQIPTQNFLTTRYVGQAPLHWYNPGEYTKKGREFLLLCRNGIPTERYRMFGTESVIHGANRGGMDLTTWPGGGEMA